MWMIAEAGEEHRQSTPCPKCALCEYNDTFPTCTPDLHDHEKKKNVPGPGPIATGQGSFGKASRNSYIVFQSEY